MEQRNDLSPQAGGLVAARRHGREVILNINRRADQLVHPSVLSTLHEPEACADAGACSRKNGRLKDCAQRETRAGDQASGR